MTEAPTPGNATLALVFCCGAGVSTIFGGMVVFSKRLVHVANPVSLAIALSVSGGVMIFISLVEMLNKSVVAFTEGFESRGVAAKVAKGHAWAVASACIGVGIALIYAIDRAVVGISLAMVKTSENDDTIQHQHHHQHHQQFFAVDEPSGCAANNMVVLLEAEGSDAHSAKMAEQTRQQLVRMGLLSVVALGLHNIPEGIATYTGAIDDSTVGLSLAIGIGIHNIPEGIAVAAPIYFATGSRRKGLLWCAVSAIAEPLSGLLAWVAIGDHMNPVTEGVVFGLVCGIMVCICVKELWPTAYKFAGPNTHYVALGTFVGMFIMVGSLILFGYAGL